MYLPGISASIARLEWLLSHHLISSPWPGCTYHTRVAQAIVRRTIAPGFCRPCRNFCQNRTRTRHPNDQSLEAVCPIRIAWPVSYTRSYLDLRLVLV